MLALNLGSLFNHANSPNLDYRLNASKRMIEYYAAKPIHPGDELCIYYGADLWFEQDDYLDPFVDDNGKDDDFLDLQFDL